MAILTVGTAKTYSTISAAITAASAGDTIEVYAGGTNNVYAEQITWNKYVNIIGMVANQGISIAPASGNVVTCSTGGLLDNFKLVGAGNVQCFTAITGATQQNTIVRRCIAYGASGSVSIGFYSQISGYAFTAENCLAYGMNRGFYSVNGAAIVARHCGAHKNATGFYSNTSAGIRAHACLAAGNTTADYNNINTTEGAYAVSADATANNVAAVTGFLTTDFVDYANNDFTLKASVAATTLARIASYTAARVDRLGQVRQRNGYLYSGDHDPNPGIVPAPAKVEVNYAYGLDLENTGTMQPGLLMPAGTRKV